MIDYIPPDIPPAIIKYADEHYKHPPEDAIGRKFKYLTVWKGNLELYNIDWSYKSLGNDPRTGQPIMRQIGLPSVYIYDCHDVRRPTIPEIHDIHFFMGKYFVRNLQSEHICHRDLEAFKKFKTPNPYKQKPKYDTPKYIPKPVVKYINKQYPVSWHPDANIRYVKYLMTYNDKYEVYFVYWRNPITQEHSKGKYVLYDCKNVRESKDIKEYFDLYSVKKVGDQYISNEKPLFCRHSL